MPKAKAAPATQEDLDVERYRLTADLAVADAESLRERSARQQALLQQASQAAHVSKEESDELYEYLDAQMLSTARDRQANEAALQTFQLESQKAHAALTQQMVDADRAAKAEISLLRVELEAKDQELRELHDFRGVRPAMEAELRALRQQIVDEQETRKREEHNLQVDLWRQREALNKQMMERVKQAKTNFLDITSEMLDSTVHRTMLENQNMCDELALMSTRLNSLLHENQKLHAECTSLKRELQLQKETEVAEVKRSLARRKLAATATAQQETLAQELQLARSELAVANERSRAQEAVVSKLNVQLAAAQRKAGALMSRVGQQQQPSGGSGPQAPSSTLLPTPNWTLILPGQDKAATTSGQYTTTSDAAAPSSAAPAAAAPSDAPQQARRRAATAPPVQKARRLTKAFAERRRVVIGRPIRAPYARSAVGRGALSKPRLPHRAAADGECGVAARRPTPAHGRTHPPHARARRLLLTPDLLSRTADVEWSRRAAAAASATSGLQGAVYDIREQLRRRLPHGQDAVSTQARDRCARPSVKR